MGRSPLSSSYEKMGLKKGTWTSEEDKILISHIQKHGHGNWRALPKLAGLLRCGKSCRLRWINYLNPHIKRGNFTTDEEDSILNLHQSLGNRWSVIASKLPGRTDNEIKNVWHTYLKKRVNKNNGTPQKKIPKTKINNVNVNIEQPTESKDSFFINQCYSSSEAISPAQMSPQPSSSEQSSLLTTAETLQFEDFPEIDESYWSEEPQENIENSTTDSEFSQMQQFCFESDIVKQEQGMIYDDDDNMNFWYDLFINSGDIQEFL
ncbi:hypothetical protein ACFE04_012041 [Oxalis oulophora]